MYVECWLKEYLHLTILTQQQFFLLCNLKWLELEETARLKFNFDFK